MECLGEQSEEQLAEPLPSVSKSINHPEAGGGVESNSSSILPLPLSEHYKKFSISDEVDLPRTNEQLFYSLNFTLEDCSKIECATRDLRNTDEWYRQRQGRLTASDFHKVYSMRKQTDPTTVARCLLSKPDISHLPAVQWGINNEDVARQDYIKEMSSHTIFVCTNAGLVVNPLFPHLGASPDGFVCCDCCGKGLLEIKCPFSGRDIHPSGLRGKPQSCLGEKGVVTSHAYYMQIQGQFVISEKQYCDLVVWTSGGIVIERVFEDANFTEKLITKLTAFYVSNIIPQLIPVQPVKFNSTAFQLAPQESIVDDIVSTDDLLMLFCFCQKEEYGKMIMCEGPDCPYTWFHYGCVGIKRARKGPWFCSDCKNSP